MPFIPKKLYYKIREVCEIVGVEAHVLRFWETEFSALSPPKSKSGQRIYRPKDIELLLRIRKLLYDEGFTIVGARKQLSAEKQPEPAPVEPAPVEPEAAPHSERLKKVKAELENILTLLDRE
jgi:DNA-binding transcriptional MerR regulator